MFPDAPKTDPTIDTEKERIAVGELLRANCTTGNSRPASAITWKLNKDLVSILSLSLSLVSCPRRVATWPYSMIKGTFPSVPFTFSPSPQVQVFPSRLSSCFFLASRIIRRGGKGGGFDHQRDEKLMRFWQWKERYNITIISGNGAIHCDGLINWSNLMFRLYIFVINSRKRTNYFAVARVCKQEG